MGIKPIPTKVFLRYLKELGLEYQRTKGSHFIYDYPAGHPNGPLMRPVTIQEKEPTIQTLHIHTNLFTLGKTKKEFEVWLKDSHTRGKSKE